MSIPRRLLGALIALAIFAWRRGRSVADVFDFAAPLPEPGLFFGRIGNFINGELWGKPTTLPWGFLYHGEVRQPSQLYEGVFEGHGAVHRDVVFTAQAAAAAGALGAVPVAVRHFRFLVEFVRMPDAQIGYLAWGWLTMGQILSLPMILVGGVLLGLRLQRPRALG